MWHRHNTKLRTRENAQNERATQKSVKSAKSSHHRSWKRATNLLIIWCAVSYARISTIHRHRQRYHNLNDRKSFFYFIPLSRALFRLFGSATKARRTLMNIIGIPITRISVKKHHKWIHDGEFTWWPFLFLPKLSFFLQSFQSVWPQSSTKTEEKRMHKKVNKLFCLLLIYHGESFIRCWSRTTFE